jgi:hypothetical protein
MSRRKDRERFLQKKQLNPEYKGFRGGAGGGVGADAPLETVTCSKCGRRRNVAVGIALEQGESYICLSCREEQGEVIPTGEAPEHQ